MEMILAWQVAVSASIAISRLYSSKAMIAVALCWTAWTLFLIWTTALVVIQLGTAWGTVWLLSSLFGGDENDVSKSSSVFEPGDEVRGKNTVSAPTDPLAVPVALNNVTIAAPAIETNARSAGSPTVRSTMNSVLDGVTNTANAATAVRQGFNSTLNDIGDSLKRQAAKMAANQEFLTQLYGLQLSIKSALQMAEKQREFQRKLSADPRLAKIYAEKKKEFEDAGQKVASNVELYAFSAAPQRPDELPPLAAEERVTELTQCRKLLAETMVGIKGDQALLQDLDKLTQKRFWDFLLTQDLVLKQHLEVLSPLKSHEKFHTVIDSFEVNAQTVSSARVWDNIEAAKIPDSKVQGSISKNALASRLSGKAERLDIKSFANECGVPHLVHFTRCENLSGILSHGLLSVAMCNTKGLTYVRNDMDRLDGQPNGISLSIAFPNYRMFYKYRQIFRDADWAVLLISPRVLWEKDCAFYRYNAADARMSRDQRDNKKSLHAFQDMFAEEAGMREAWLRRCDPSDPQAEVLVYEMIPCSYIDAVAFETREVSLKYTKGLGRLESLYAGFGKGLFGTRKHARTL